MNNTNSFEDVFRSRMFHIPDYQRGYAWERKQVNDLIDDLGLLAHGRTHFTGTLVMKKIGETKFRDENGLTYDQYDVIDGQQRLTTIVLLLDVLHDEFERLGKNGLAEGLRKTYLSIFDKNGLPQTKLTLNRDCQKYFYNDVLGFSKTITGPVTRSHMNLLDAHTRFEEYIASLREMSVDEYTEKLILLYEKITASLTVLMYEVDDETDAGVIFETMNDRGKPLTDLEKIKNYFLYIASKLDLEDVHDLSSKINQTWNLIFEELMVAGLADEENEKQLIRSIWLVVYNPDPKYWRRYDTIKEHFSLKRYKNNHTQLLKDLIYYLDILRNSVTAYCDILNPYRTGAYHEYFGVDIQTQVQEYSEKLVRLGSLSSFTPLLISVRLKTEGNGYKYLKVLKLCELFDFRVYKWIRARTTAGQSTMYRIAFEFFRNNSIEYLETRINQKTLSYCSNKRFEERFILEADDWYHWSGLKYFLYEYELYMARCKHEKTIYKWEDLWDVKRDTIEHILPQTPSGSWLESFPDESRRNRWLHDIGNLTLTYDNISLSNKSFKDKCGVPAKESCYASSSFFIERQLTSYSKWTEEEIIHRRNVIRNWVLSRWSIDESFNPPEISEISLETIKGIAEESGVENELEAIFEFVKLQNLHLRPYKQSVAIATPRNRNIALCTIWPKNGYLDIGVWFSNFVNSYKIPMIQIQSLFNTSKDNIRIVITKDNICEFTKNFTDIIEYGSYT